MLTASVVIGFLSVIPNNASHYHRLTVPREAKIQIDARGSDEPQNGAECLADVDSALRVRWKLNHFEFAETSDTEIKNYSKYRQCWTSGTIQSKGQVYPFVVRSPDIVITSFPDGKQKLFQVTGASGIDPYRPVHRNPPRPPHLHLPVDAVITPGRSMSKVPGTDCSYFKLTEKALRRRFATYDILVDNEFTQNYEFLPCAYSGTFTVHGQTFDYEARQGNLLTTNYPEAHVSRILGGPPTGSANADYNPPSDPDVPEPGMRRRK